MDTTTTAPTGAPAAGNTTDTTAPAAAEAAPPKVSAQVDAATRGDVSGFMEADRAARSGKPLDKVERPRPVGKGGEPAKGPTPQQVAADERIASRVREAVETSTAELRRQNKELLDRINGGKPAAAAAPGGDKAKPAPETRSAASEVKRFLSMPDAPKIEDFDAVTDYNAAVSLFIGGKQTEERAAADAEHRSAFGRVEREIERVKTFHGRIEEYKKANPDFGKQLSPEVGGLHGFARLQEINAERAQRGDAPIPATVDHAIGEEIYDSAIPGAIAVHLSKPENAADLAALRACTNPPALLRAFAKLEAKVSGASASASSAAGQPAATPKQQAADLRSRADAVVDRSVSQASPPAPTLGRAGTHVDPIRQAVEKGDFGMFQDLDRQARAEKRGLGAR